LLGNFAAHAGTVVTYPGEPLLSSIVAIVSALAFPASGIVRGVTAIVRHAALVSDPLQQAAQAGALCMVVRNKDWLPKDGDTLRDIVFRGKMIRTGKSRDRSSCTIQTVENPINIITRFAKSSS
jgi:hypothetical protein